MRRFLLLLVLPCAAACDIYDPDLGNQPFRCGETEPRCPDGYGCIARGPGEEYCELGADDDDDDGVTADCVTDPREPNDQLTTATATAISVDTGELTLSQMSICPDTDVDLFRLVLSTQSNIRVDLRHSTVRGVLALDLLNPDGTSIGAGTPIADPNIVRVQRAELSQGIYYVQVRAPAGVQNSYDLDLITSIAP